MRASWHKGYLSEASLVFLNQKFVKSAKIFKIAKNNLIIINIMFYCLYIDKYKLEKRQKIYGHQY